MSQQSKTIDRDEYFKAYQEHSRTLRTWLVAYGIGMLILLITKDRPWDTIIKSGFAIRVAGLTIAGISAQVLISLMNKMCNWFCYYGEFKPNFKLRWPYKVARWFEDQFIVDCLFDFFTLATFVWSTWYLFKAFCAFEG